MSVVAPHLVHRLPFLFPFYEDGPYRPWFVQTGIIVYSTLARARLNGFVERGRARRDGARAPRQGLRSCGLYDDAWTNDGRLTLANVRGAADRGAAVLNYAEVVSIGAGGAEVVADGRTIAVRGAERRQRVRPMGRPYPPARGSGRAAVDPPEQGRARAASTAAQDWTAALTIPHDKVRVSFAVPWEGMLLLGTTDTQHDGEPEDVAVTDEDVEQVLAEAAGRRRGPRPGPRDLLRPARAARRARAGPRTRGARRCSRTARRAW